MTLPNSSVFQMQGAREAVIGGFAHIEQQVKAIEQAVLDNPSLAFDLAKTLIESVCRTILKEHSVSYSNNDDVPKLFKLVSESLPLLPASASQEGEIRKSLLQTLNGLNTVIQGICEMRNQCGFASHGSDSPRPSMEFAQAALVANAADTVIGFLYRVHQQNLIAQSEQRLSFDDHPDFNEWVDSTCGMVQIFELEFRPSKILFEMDLQGYRNYLAEFGLENNDGETRDA